MAPSCVRAPLVVALAPLEGLFIYARVTLVVFVHIFKKQNYTKKAIKNNCLNAQHECVWFCCQYLKLYVRFWGTEL